MGVNVILILHLLCRDRLTRNDSIGTIYLNLAKIASSGGEVQGMILVLITLHHTVFLPFTISIAQVYDFYVIVASSIIV